MIQLPDGERVWRIIEAMVDNPRWDGEDVCSWLDRVTFAAGEMTLSQCDAIQPAPPEGWAYTFPEHEREPGEDG